MKLVEKDQWDEHLFYQTFYFCYCCCTYKFAIGCIHILHIMLWMSLWAYMFSYYLIFVSFYVFMFLLLKILRKNLNEIIQKSLWATSYGICWCSKKCYAKNGCPFPIRFFRSPSSILAILFCQFSYKVIFLRIKNTKLNHKKTAFLKKIDW